MLGEENLWDHTYRVCSNQMPPINEEYIMAVEQACQKLTQGESVEGKS